MNFMDYVDDNCMHLFTKGQGEKMRNILSNERAALATGFEFICNLTTSSSERAINQFSITPNPSEDVFSILIPELNHTDDLQIEIFDISGQRMEARSFEIRHLGETVQLSLGDMPNGTYILKARHGEEIFVNKLLLMSRH